MNETWIIDAVRTPRGKGKKDTGALSGVHPQELMACTLRALESRNPIDLKDIEDVAVGVVSQVGEQGACLARSAVLAAGWPQEIAGVTLNRFCGSGLQGVNYAVMGVMSGQMDMAVGGGVESMSRQPMGSDGAGLDGNHQALRDRYAMVPQGISADLVATMDGYTREQLDAYAASSQQRAGRAIEDGRFDGSLIPVRDADGNTVLTRDELPRPETTQASLSALEPAFVGMGGYAPWGGETFDELALRAYPHVAKIEHMHHAGNSSGIVDGASAVLVASADYAREHGLKPRARVRGTATIGAEPVIMFTAPGPASRRALKKAGMDVADIDLWEINEAFAVVPLRVTRELELDADSVNVNGGAIALGHPLGATGGMLLGAALDELDRSDKETALVTLCIAGGMGIATIVERV